jgi:hypothetical protein
MSRPPHPPKFSDRLGQNCLSGLVPTAF